MFNLNVLYEDNHFIAIDKPAGWLSQGDKTNDSPIAEKVAEYIRQKYNKPGNVFTGIIHRLDRPVSGLMLIAKTSKALSRCNEVFKSRNIKKTYYAVVIKKPSKHNDTLTHFLVKDSRNNTTKAYNTSSKGGKEAILKYYYIKSFGNYHLLKVEPLTGRAHQIRVQLASIGCLIANDVKYGAIKTDDPKMIYLHAYSLEFTHPIKKAPAKIVCPIPKNKLWNSFND